MRTSQARERLLAAAVGRALDTGIADLSLRQLAAAMGTSHRMLLYHFGSREGLLAAVTQAVEDQQRAALLQGGIRLQDARQSWERLSDPKLWPQERLFFELYAHAPRGRPGTEGFLDGIVESWTAPVADAMVKPARTNERPGPTPASAWPWSAAFSWTCSPPETAPGSPKPTSDSSPAHPPPPPAREAADARIHSPDDAQPGQPGTEHAPQPQSAGAVRNVPRSWGGGQNEQSVRVVGADVAEATRADSAGGVPDHCAGWPPLPPRARRAAGRVNHALVGISATPLRDAVQETSRQLIARRSLCCPRAERGDCVAAGPPGTQLLAGG